jgi:hypothetical protein
VLYGVINEILTLFYPLLQDFGCRSTSLTGKLQKFQECNMDEEPEFVEFSQWNPSSCCRVQSVKPFLLLQSSVCETLPPAAEFSLWNPSFCCRVQLVKPFLGRSVQLMKPFLQLQSSASENPLSAANVSLENCSFSCRVQPVNPSYSCWASQWNSFFACCIQPV